MLVGIDGTAGGWDDADYWNMNHNSFVSRAIHFANAARPGSGKYFHGPYPGGLGTDRIAGLAVDYIRSNINYEDPEPIFLVGHSRGGASCIRVAEILDAEEWIDAMFLFDAVRMTTRVDTECIPRNVKRVYHAIRDPRIGSRASWGNTGLQYSRPTLYIKRIFSCTHAGVGGTPWTGDFPTETHYRPAGRSGVAFEVPTITQAQDEAGSTQVRHWMFALMYSLGAIGAYSFAGGERFGKNQAYTW
jgi:hypothetical protein